MCPSLALQAPAAPRMTGAPMVSVVVIGRNEGQRLAACLASVRAFNRDGMEAEVIYVDSQSTDGSPDLAERAGAHVIRVSPERPSAALGRNAGWRAARGRYILFLDGDTRLHPDFVQRALEQFRQPDVAVVWGHRRERDPDQSVYVRVLDLDWVYPPGDSQFCGGDALVRRDVLVQAGGFDESLIAGEEPELCRRMRAIGYRIAHIDAPMTQHDLAMNSFGSYWRRAFRAGHAYAELAARFRGTRDPLWQSESRRNLIHGTALIAGPLAVLLEGLLLPMSVALPVIGAQLALLLVLLGRTARRSAWKCGDPFTCWQYAIHSHFQQLPILLGQLAQRLDARRGRQRRLIEYKHPAGSVPRRVSKELSVTTQRQPGSGL
jgi:glycosyltransferase involved in cell wall biosynthesis